jgi:hypothetical protein
MTSSSFWCADLASEIYIAADSRPAPGGKIDAGWPGPGWPGSRLQAGPSPGRRQLGGEVQQARVAGEGAGGQGCQCEYRHPSTISKYRRGTRLKRSSPGLPGVNCSALWIPSSSTVWPTSAPHMPMPWPITDASSVLTVTLVSAIICLSINKQPPAAGVLCPLPMPMPMHACRGTMPMPMPMQ